MHGTSGSGVLLEQGLGFAPAHGVATWSCGGHVLPFEKRHWAQGRLYKRCLKICVGFLL